MKIPVPLSLLLDLLEFLGGISVHLPKGSMITIELTALKAEIRKLITEERKP